MSKEKTMLTGSINFTELKNLVERNKIEPHTNGKIYVPVTAFMNDEPDKFGNHLTMTAKDDSLDKWVYFANLKKR